MLVTIITNKFTRGEVFGVHFGWEPILALVTRNINKYGRISEKEVGSGKGMQIFLWISEYVERHGMQGS